MPTFLSLFSGIGGLDLAMEAMGFECVGQVEWDASCAKVLERHWPDVPRWSDIATYPDGGGLSVERQPELARIEGALGNESDGRGAGGQVVANAARTGAGMDAGREAGSGASALSGRAASVVGLAADRGVDLIAGGFPCQPVSQAGGRKAQADSRWLWPQFARVIRELGPRWVVVENVPGLFSAGDPAGSALGEVLRDLAEIGFDARWNCVRASDVGAPHRRERVFLLAERADADGERRALVGERSLQVGDRREPQPEPGRVDEAVAAHAEDADGRIGEAWPTSGARRRRGGSGGETPFAWGPYAAAISRWESVMGPAPHPVDGKGRLDPAFVEWMMGFPAGWTSSMTRTQALKALGNAVVPAQAFAALTRIRSEGDE